jgi:hypothetical protein
VALVALAAVASAWCGATPWRGRVLSRRIGPLPGEGRVETLVAASTIAVLAAVLACTVAGDAGRVAAVVVVGAGDAAVAMALTATRQWRFAPRGRARDAALLVGAAALVAVAGVGAVDAAWWSVPAVAVGAVLAVVVGRPSVACSDASGARASSARRS